MVYNGFCGFVSLEADNLRFVLLLFDVFVVVAVVVVEAAAMIRPLDGPFKVAVVLLFAALLECFVVGAGSFMGRTVDDESVASDEAIEFGSVVLSGGGYP